MAGEADIGVLGLAVMGANLARNAARHRFGVAVFNRNPERTDALIAGHGGEGRFFPSRSSSQARSMRRWRVFACFASSTQQMNSLRPSGVSFSHSARTFGSDRSAA